jgi:hypothetical protein
VCVGLVSLGCVCVCVFAVVCVGLSFVQFWPCVFFLLLLIQRYTALLRIGEKNTTILEYLLERSVEINQALI